MTAGAAEVHVRHRRFVLAKLRNRTERAALVGEKRALTKGAANGANDFARDIKWRMSDPLQDFCFQVRNVVRSDKVDEVIGVWFARLLPGTCRNFTGCIASDVVGHTEDDKFHQRPASRRPTWIYCRIVPTNDHRCSQQKTTTTL